MNNENQQIRIAAAKIVAGNWRIAKRLPKLAALATKLRIAELESQIGCGAPIKSYFMADCDSKSHLVDWTCGRYYGDDGPDYCEDCRKLIDELIRLDGDEIF